MAKRRGKSKKYRKNNFKGPKKEKAPLLTSRLKRWIGALLMALLALVILFSFFQKAGSGGREIFKVFSSAIGKTIYFFPFLLLLGAFLLLKPSRRRILAPVLLGLLLSLFGISGILGVRNVAEKQGGALGNLLAWPLLRYFSLPIGLAVFSVFILTGLLVLYEMVPKKPKEDKEKTGPAFVKATAGQEKPKFEIKTVELFKKKPEEQKEKMAFAEQAVEKLLGKSFNKDKQKKDKKEEAGFALDAEYKMPPFNLLDTKEEIPSSGDTNQNSIIIQRTLQNFGIEVEMAEINVGPTVTQYTLKPAEGVKLSRITSLNNDMALALAAHPIRIEAPVPGRALVGIEVPNKQRAVVKTGGLIVSDKFQQSPPLTFALGKDVMGNMLNGDLGRMPHLLVAGATGSGKTICLNSLISSLIFRNSPKILRLILIDPKKVEFPVYENLPHLLTPVILNARKAVNALNWLVGEMDRRFDVLREFGVRDIVAYNSELAKKPKKQEDFETMPYIVLIIDELADLMMAKGKEVEAAVVRLSQLARAVGIHLVVATQRPSVEVITGLIKANITSRVAFQVASQIDSRTILDAAGAEKLLGRGDMLFISAEFSKPKRIQGGFISSAEIKKVVDFIVKENSAEQREEIDEANQEPSQDSSTPIGSFSEVNREDIVNYETKDDLYDEAKEVVMQYQKASASLLQRRLQIGYARAARILDMLEQDGIVGQAEGAKPREILVNSQGAKEDDGFQDPNKIEFQ